MALTEGTNSYISVDDADTYFALAIHASVWASLDLSVKESALVTATRMLDRQKWVGTKTVLDATTQPLQWPRTYVTDRNGTTVPSDTVPQEIIDATCELAIALINDPSLQNTTDSGSNIKRVKADTVEIEYIRTKSGTRFPVVINELVGLWLSSSSTISGPFLSGTDNESTLSDTFDLNGSL